jgi:hypothetical protein
MFLSKIKKVRFLLKPDFVLWAALFRLNGSGFNHAEAQPHNEDINAENNNELRSKVRNHNSSIKLL